MPIGDAISATGRARRRFLRVMLGMVSIAPFIAGCAIATPYKSVASRAVADDAGAVVVVVTEATLGSDDAARDAFWDGVGVVQSVLADQPGLIGYSLRRELFGDRTWTMTEWRSEADVERFVRSPAHQRAMRLGSSALAGVRFARLTRSADGSPLSWDEAIAALESGRDSYE